MRGHGHDTSGAVIGQNKIGGVNRHLFTSQGIFAVSFQKDTFLFIILGSAHQLVLLFNFFYKLQNIFFDGLAFGQFHDQRMLGGNQHEGCPEECILTGSKYLDGAVAVGHWKINFTAVAFANPVFLHGHDAFRPTGQFVAIFQQLFDVGGDFEKPLIQHLFLHFRAAAPALAAFNLFVGQHRIALTAEINRGALFVSQTFFIHPDKEQLFPAVIFRLAGGYFPIPVVAEAHAFELLFHVIDIFVGPLSGMNFMLDGGVFRGQAESVPAHWMQNVETLHAFITGNNIADGVITDMADMNFTGRIRKHLQQIVFFLLRIFSNFEGIFIFPFFLPFLFNCNRFVLHDQ